MRHSGTISALDNWPGQQISVVFDSEEHLLGLLSRDMENVHEAVWSNSTFLSCMHHNNLAGEIRWTIHRSDPGDLEAAGEEDLDRITLLEFRPPGLQTLLRRYHPSSPLPGELS